MYYVSNEVPGFESVVFLLLFAEAVLHTDQFLNSQDG
jgi:hypothetical protein